MTAAATNPGAERTEAGASGRWSDHWSDRAGGYTLLALGGAITIASLTGNPIAWGVAAVSGLAMATFLGFSIRNQRRIDAGHGESANGASGPRSGRTMGQSVTQGRPLGTQLTEEPAHRSRATGAHPSPHPATARVGA